MLNENYIKTDWENHGCILGKRHMKLSDFYLRDQQSNDNKNVKIEDAFFTNERIKTNKDCSFSNLQINQSIFKNMGLDNLTYKDCDFKHNTFINCYFRKSEFSDINFTGCRFIGCNFDDVVLLSCNFEYSQFEKCFIKYNVFKKNIPTRVNLRWKLCKIMYIQAKEAGSYEDYQKYFFAEKRASYEHEKKIAFYRSEDDRYYKKYSSFDRTISFLKCIKLKLERLIWGYGESITKLIVSGLFFLLVFAVIHLLCDKDLGFFQAVKIGFTNIIGVGVLESTCQLNGLVYAERVFGILFIGLFVTALFKYINRG